MLELLTGWFFSKAIYAVIAVILGFGVVAVYTDWLSIVLVSIGYFFLSIGLAIKDKKITKEELDDIRNKISDVVKSVKAIPRKKDGK